MKQVLTIISLAIGLAMSPLAFADCGGGNGNDDPPSGGCGGGAGGNGGSGGVGVGVGIGVGIAKQQQQQQQQQQQSLRNSIRVKNNVHNTNTNKNKNTATGGNASNNTYVQIGGNGEGEGGELVKTTVNVSTPAAAVDSSPNDMSIKTVGIASTPNIYPTAPCMGTSSLSVGFMGGAFGSGTSWKDDDCSYRETARMFDQLGYKKDGIVVMCQSEYAKAAPSCKAIAAEATKQASLAEQNAALREKLASREGSRTSEEDQRKTDATVRAEGTIPTQSASYNTCESPVLLTDGDWTFSTTACTWVQG